KSALGGDFDGAEARLLELASQVEAGELEVLAVMSEDRLDSLPDVPTLKEKDIDVVMGTWRGLGVPADTPDDIVEILADAYSEAINSGDFEKFMNEQEMNMRFMDNEEFTEFVESERPLFEELAKEVKDSEDE